MILNPDATKTETLLPIGFRVLVTDNIGYKRGWGGGGGGGRRLGNPASDERRVDEHNENTQHKTKVHAVKQEHTRTLLGADPKALTRHVGVMLRQVLGYIGSNGLQPSAPLPFIRGYIYIYVLYMHMYDRPLLKKHGTREVFPMAYLAACRASRAISRVCVCVCVYVCVCVC